MFSAVVLSVWIVSIVRGPLLWVFPLEKALLVFQLIERSDVDVMGPPSTFSAYVAVRHVQ